MSISNILIIPLILFMLCSCVKPYCEYEDFEWIYYDKESKNGLGHYQLGGSQCEYLFWADNSLIYVESKCTKRCNVLNKMGMVVDSFSYNEQRSLHSMQRIDTLKKYIWKYKIALPDTSLISNVEYISYPIESPNLFSRRLPKREQRINFDMEDENYSFVLKDVFRVKNIIQYDSKSFLISLETTFMDISNRSNYYVVMLDLEKLAQRKLFGMTLPYTPN